MPPELFQTDGIYWGNIGFIKIDFRDSDSYFGGWKLILEYLGLYEYHKLHLEYRVKVIKY